MEHLDNGLYETHAVFDVSHRRSLRALRVIVARKEQRQHRIAAQDDSIARDIRWMITSGLTLRVWYNQGHDIAK